MSVRSAQSEAGEWCPMSNIGVMCESQLWSSGASWNCILCKCVVVSRVGKGLRLLWYQIWVVVRRKENVHLCSRVLLMDEEALNNVTNGMKIPKD